MLNRLLAGVAFLLGTSTMTVAQRSAHTLLLRNRSDVAFTDVVVDIPWATVQKAYPRLDTARMRVVQLPDNRPVPYQLERRGEKTVQHLLVQVSAGPKQTVRLAILPEKASPTLARTYCRYVPERKDDFAWENDRIAFRIYGRTLESTSENAYGTDIWCKRTSDLIINKWYKKNDYHRDNGDGLDYYKVGFTLGAGNVGVYQGDTLAYFRNYESWQVLDNGPLRSTFTVRYAPQQFGPATVTLTKTISLDANAQLSRVQFAITQPGGATPLPMVAGITLRPDGGEVRLDEKTGVMRYWEPPHGTDSTVGVACLFPTQSGIMLEAHKHALTRLVVRPGAPVTYYTGGVWDKAGRITSAADWDTYLRQTARQIQQPMTVTIGE